MVRMSSDRGCFGFGEEGEEGEGVEGCGGVYWFGWERVMEVDVKLRTARRQVARSEGSGKGFKRACGCGRPGVNSALADDALSENERNEVLEDSLVNSSGE